jgi:TonB family protein
MVAVTDPRLLARGPTPREVWITFGLSVLFHAALTGVIVLVPRFQVGKYITVPVSYTVSLVEAPPGGRGEKGGAAAAAPAQTAPAPRAGPAPPPASRPAEELTLPGRRTARKPTQPLEPSLRPPTVTGRESVQSPPRTAAAPPPAVATAPSTAPPVASAGAGTGAGKGSGVEVAGAGGGAGGGSTLAYYLTLVDRKIQDNWVPLGAAGPSETVVVVRFRVLRSGQVRDVQLETGSGNAGVDATALRAIRQSLPLPPFPNLLTEPSLDLRYRFVMERG